MASANNIERLREERGWKRPELARRMGTSPQQVERLEKAQRKLTTDWIDRAADAFGVSAGDIIGQMPARPLRDSFSQQRPDGAASDDDTEMVGIRMIDMAYGMGATYAVDYPEVDVLRFPKQWIEAISHAPPAMLTWARGRGDSMEPTIRDGDLVLLDQSQRTLTERDAMWAFTIGEEAAIKRLRRQGERCQIFSDNPAVPPDEQLLRDIHIVGRVVFVGARK